MKTERRKRKIERRAALAGDWKPQTARSSETALFNACFELAESASALERVTGSKGSGGAIAASLGCVTAAFDSLATAALNLRGVVIRELPPGGDDAERIARLLFAIDQNLRFASHAADLGRQTAAALPPAELSADLPKGASMRGQ